MAGSPWPKWKRGNESNLSKTDITDGNILITIDTGRMFIDIDGKRIEVSDFIKKKESDILAILAPLPKLYLATDTKKLYFHDGENWCSMEAGLADKIKATANAKAKGYLLGFTSENETPIYDSQVYLDIVSGDLHANTFNGFALTAAAAKEISDSNQAEAIGTGENLVTERDVYYGLPSFNNAHDYTSNNGYFAPTTGGTSGYILKSNGTTSAPTWLAPSTLLANLGCGYGTCSTDEATAAKVVVLSNYALVKGGFIAVKFDNEVPAEATLNVNSKGAKSIYHNGEKIQAGVIEANSIALFVYDGANYALIATDFGAGNDYGNHLELEGVYTGSHLELE